MRFWAVMILSVPLFSYGEAVERIVAVTGQCVRQVVPDRSMVSLTAESLTPTVAESTQKTSDIYNKLREGLKGLRLKELEIETKGFNLYEEREWQKDKSIFKGYKATSTIEISTSDIGRIGEVIPLASKLGAKNIGGLTSYVSPQKMIAEREACLETAIENAKSKASRMTKAAGVKLGRPLQMSENSSLGGARPIAFAKARVAMAMEMDSAGAPPQIEAGVNTITVDVNVSFSIE